MEGQDVRTVLSGSKLFWGPFLAQLRVKLSFPADSNWLKCIPLVSLYVSHIMFPPYPENETIASGTVSPFNKVVLQNYPFYLIPITATGITGHLISDILPSKIPCVTKSSVNLWRHRPRTRFFVEKLKQVLSFKLFALIFTYSKNWQSATIDDEETANTT